jgi:cytidylate kinase
MVPASLDKPPDRVSEGVALRVLAVAPLEVRIRNVMEEEGLVEHEARRRFVLVEADRRTYLMKQFHSEFADPTGFDVVVNTASLGVEGSTDVIRRAVALRAAGAGAPVRA